MEAEGRQLQKEVNEYQMLLSALTKAEKQKEQFQEKLEQSAKETADAKTALERSRVMLESLEGSKDYQNQQEAQAAYAKADTAKKEKRCTCHAGRGETAKSTGTGKPGTDLNCKV